MSESKGEHGNVLRLKFRGNRVWKAMHATQALDGEVVIRSLTLCPRYRGTNDPPRATWTLPTTSLRDTFERASHDQTNKERKHVELPDLTVI